MDMILVYYPGHLGTGARSRLRDPTRGLKWQRAGEVKAVPRDDAQDLLRLAGGFLECLTAAQAVQRFGASEELVASLIDRRKVTTAKGPGSGTVLVLDARTRKALRPPKKTRKPKKETNA